jgi:hypothetical protein
LAKDESSIGRVGVLLVATRGSAGPGEVLVKIRGGSEAFLAWSERPLPKGATVLVIDSRGARAVDVIEWDDALGDSPSLPGLHPVPSRLTPAYLPGLTPAYLPG